MDFWLFQVLRSYILTNYRRFDAFVTHQSFGVLITSFRQVERLHSQLGIGQDMAKRELRVAVSATKTSAFITITADSRPKPGRLRRPFLSELTMASPFEPFGRT